MLEQGGAWDRYLHLIDFTYNNSSILVLEWHRSRLCMGGDVGFLCVGTNWARALCFQTKYCLTDD